MPFGFAPESAGGRGNPVSTSPTDCVAVFQVFTAPSLSTKTPNVRSSENCVPAGGVSAVPDDHSVAVVNPLRTNTRLPSRLICVPRSPAGSAVTDPLRRSTRHRPAPGTVALAPVDRTTT